jgi:hypothetical protein
MLQGAEVPSEEMLRQLLCPACIMWGRIALLKDHTLYSTFTTVVSSVYYVGSHCPAEGSHFSQYIHNYHDNKNPLTEMQGKVTIMKLEGNKLGNACSAEHL